MADEILQFEPEGGGFAIRGRREGLLWRVMPRKGFRPVVVTTDSRGRETLRARRRMMLLYPAYDLMAKRTPAGRIRTKGPGRVERGTYGTTWTLKLPETPRLSIFLPFGLPVPSVLGTFESVAATLIPDEPAWVVEMNPAWEREVVAPALAVMLLEHYA